MLRNTALDMLCATQNWASTNNSRKIHAPLTGNVLCSNSAIAGFAPDAKPGTRNPIDVGGSHKVLIKNLAQH